MTHKRTPPAEGPGAQNHSVEVKVLVANDRGGAAGQPWAECPPYRIASRPLRSFKKEHNDFCRLVVAPKVVDRALHAKRIEAAWRSIRAAGLKKKPIDRRAIAERMAGYAALFSYPYFCFDVLDAERMALDVAFFDKHVSEVHG